MFEEGVRLTRGNDFTPRFLVTPTSRPWQPGISFEQAGARSRSGTGAQVFTPTGESCTQVALPTMNDPSWTQLAKLFPHMLVGASFSTADLPTPGKAPPFICGAFSPDGTLIALSGGGRIPSRPLIWVARVPSLETVVSLGGHQGVHALAWDPITDLLASASNDYTAVLWDVARHDHVFPGGDDAGPIVKGHVAFGSNVLYVGETEAFEDFHARLLRISLDSGEVAVFSRPRGWRSRCAALRPTPCRGSCE